DPRICPGGVGQVCGVCRDTRKIDRRRGIEYGAEHAELALCSLGGRGGNRLVGHQRSGILVAVEHGSHGLFYVRWLSGITIQRSHIRRTRVVKVERERLSSRPAVYMKRGELEMVGIGTKSGEGEVEGTIFEHNRKSARFIVCVLTFRPDVRDHAIRRNLAESLSIDLQVAALGGESEVCEAALDLIPTAAGPS